uniref:Putative secreted protein n=1 Tax=Lutzomyia longipalpis TaxID=7200 RepID=A0A1B0GHK5_LUTLO
MMVLVGVLVHILTTQTLTVTPIDPKRFRIVITRPQSSEESSESLSSGSFESHELGHKTKVVSYTSGVHGHGGGTFFDGVFGIPIATLSAVNQFLNGKAAGGGVGFQKTVTIAKV